MHEATKDEEREDGRKRGGMRLQRMTTESERERRKLREEKRN